MVGWFLVELIYGVLVDICAGGWVGRQVGYQVYLSSSGPFLPRFNNNNFEAIVHEQIVLYQRRKLSKIGTAYDFAVDTLFAFVGTTLILFITENKKV